VPAPEQVSARPVAGSREELLAEADAQEPLGNPQPYRPLVLILSSRAAA
jgi:hypothetical protein